MSSSKNIGLKGPDLLAEFEDNWQTSIGSIIFGKGAQLRGEDIFEEFGNQRWMELLVFSVTGRKSPTVARLLDGLWIISTSYPDPRLWNNRVTALAGTVRSTGALGISAGIAVSEATIYGLKPIRGATELLYRFKKQLDQGHSLESLIQTELKNYRAVYGYGRPMTSGDERIAPLMKFAKTLNAEKGIYIDLAFEISDYFNNSRYKYEMNIAAVAAGLVADQGLTATEFYHLATLCFTSGMFPCYIDATNHHEGTLFPLSTGRINYTGAPTNKKWFSGDDR